jgi:hypothetical protein
MPWHRAGLERFDRTAVDVVLVRSHGREPNLTYWTMFPDRIFQLCNFCPIVGHKERWYILIDECCLDAKITLLIEAINIQPLLHVFVTQE